MDLSFLLNYLDLIIFGICLCVGFIIKNSFDFIPNKYIPVIVGMLGLVINIVSNLPSITPSIILTGLFSGLAATGAYEAFKNLIDKGEKEE